jgi:Spy/CpxP family protein refolding chaperone
MRPNCKNIVALLALGGVMAFAPSLLAQDASTNAPAGGPPAGAPGGQMRGQSVDLMLQRLTTRLNLTPDEQAKVKPILENQMQQMAALRGVAPEDRRTKIMALRQEVTTNMEAVLDTNQFALYQQMTQRRRPMMGQGGPGGPGGFGGSTNAPAAPTPPPQQ